MKRHAFIARAALLAIALTVAGLALFGCKPSGPGAGGGSNPNLITLTEANFQAEVLSSPQPVLVDFWATWCGPCKIIAPVVSELATEYKGRAKVAKLDVDTAPALAQKYGIQSIPALLFFKDGKVIDQSIGVVSKKELQGKLDKLLPAAAPGGSDATR